MEIRDLVTESLPPGTVNVVATLPFLLGDILGELLASVFLKCTRPVCSVRGVCFVVSAASLLPDLSRLKTWLVALVGQISLFLLASSKSLSVISDR